MRSTMVVHGRKIGERTPGYQDWGPYQGILIMLHQPTSHVPRFSKTPTSLAGGINWLSIKSGSKPHGRNLPNSLSTDLATTLTLQCSHATVVNRSRRLTISVSTSFELSQNLISGSDVMLSIAIRLSSTAILIYSQVATWNHLTCGSGPLLRMVRILVPWWIDGSCKYW